MLDKFPIFQQQEQVDCGATCLRMIARYYGKYYSIDYLRDISYTHTHGVSLFGIAQAAETIGMQTLGASVTYDKIVEDLPLPLIAYWNQEHFVVVYKATNNYVWVADPAVGKRKMSKAEFLEGWLVDADTEAGVVLMLETTAEFDQKASEKANQMSKGSFAYLKEYLLKEKNLVWQLMLGLLATLFLQLLFPFLMKSVIDQGVDKLDVSFVWLVVGAWLLMMLLRVGIEHVRSWMLMHLGLKANINLISDFLYKIVKLPIRYFDRKFSGDLLQKIYDNERVEQMLSNSLITVFSMINIVILGGLLAYFDIVVFLIFLVATCVYLLWMRLFANKRRELDYLRFDFATQNQNKLLELIDGMQDIKLHNAELQKRWDWERAEAQLFEAGSEYLANNRRQLTGSRIINDCKNILITGVAAKAVIEGSMSLGALFAIQYILAQIDRPIESVLQFFRSWQDASIALSRMNEVYRRDEEEEVGNKIKILPENGDLKLDNVSFQYDGPGSVQALERADVLIEKGKKTAIVGISGSGKTTLIKLLLNIYKPSEGIVKIGDISIDNFKQKVWVDKCGSVLQDGHIFSDSIAGNIGLGDDVVNADKLIRAVKIANLQTFIERLPMGYDTKLGTNGMGLSKGQRQRLLIARAVYKNPEYLFLDEALDGLDPHNQNIIIKNLDSAFEGQTLIVASHRMKAVRNADHIVVLEDGKVMEEGTHDYLLFKNGVYAKIMQAQL